jgi:hypothetical protein
MNIINWIMKLEIDYAVQHIDIQTHYCDRKVIRNVNVVHLHKKTSDIINRTNSKVPSTYKNDINNGTLRFRMHTKLFIMRFNFISE